MTRIRFSLYLSAIVIIGLLVNGCNSGDSSSGSAAVDIPYGIDVAPNGNIVFVGVGTGGTDLYILEPKTGKVSAITRSEDYEYGPAFDRNGLRVVYGASKTPLGEYHIMVIPASGGRPIQLTTAPGSDFSPRFSRDGKKITFSRSASSHSYAMGGGNKLDTWEMYVMNSDGKNLRQVTNGRYYEAHNPDFCDSDTKIVFNTWDNKGYSLYAVDITAKSTSPVYVTDCGYESSCSPDGKSVVCSSDKAVAFHEEVHIVDLSSKKDRQLTHLNSRVTCPVFTKDGKRILFLCDPDPRYSRPDLWVVNVDGTNAHKIADNSLFLQPLAWKKGSP